MRRKNEQSWQPTYSTEGMMSFDINGYVQDIKEDENNEVDYVQFNIDNPFKKGNINGFSITVPWDDDIPMLQKGQKVNIFGLVRSWWDRDTQRVTYSFVAQKAQVIPEVKENEGREYKKSRRGG